MCDQQCTNCKCDILTKMLHYAGQAAAEAERLASEGNVKDATKMGQEYGKRWSAYIQRKAIIRSVANEQS